MKSIILAGGKGTRLYEETEKIPKSLVEIGGKPIIWHIIKIYAHFGITEFLICGGYKFEELINFFKNNFTQTNDVISEKEIIFRIDDSVPLTITLVDTGLETMTGGRLKKIQNFVDSTFHLTYGDTLSNVNIDKLVSFHKSHNGLATVTACHPPEKYGILKIQDNLVTEFKEKPPMDNVWVNGGFFVLEPKIFEYIDNDFTIWEKEPMMHLTNKKSLYAFKHEGFYQPMNTMKDKMHLDSLWNSKQYPWKVW